MKLIINADDYGMNENVSTAIVESFKKGYINQTTLMVNMPWAEQAVELARKEGIFGQIGLHLNLTQGRPLTERMAHSELFCDAAGLFNPHAAWLSHQFWRYSEDVTSLIREEVEAQIKRYCDFALPLMHLDSHHHVHHRLPLAALVMPMMAKYGFKTIRLPYSIGFKGIKACVRKGRNLLFKYVARQNGLCATDAFGAAETFEIDPFCTRGFKSVELMVHPMYKDNGDLINVTDYMNVDGSLMSATHENIEEGLCKIV